MSSAVKNNGFISEVLRLLVVIFCGAIGFQIGTSIVDDPDAEVLGIFTAPVLGLIVGAGLGYSLGGALTRYLIKALDRGDRALEGITPEELVAGTIGAIIGSVLAAIVVWPIFLVTEPIIGLAVFAFLVVLAAAFGFTVGQRRREAVLSVAAGKTGVRTDGRQTNPIRLLDTSIAIDARIIDVTKAGFGLGRIVVCQPVLDELQQLADTSEETRRAKGRRGLDTLEALRRTPGVDLQVIADEFPEVTDTDGKLVQIALHHNYALLTTDTGLARVAQVSGVQVQNLHALSVALRPPVTVGETLPVHLIREGKEVGQGVGYLNDGTMVVVEDSHTKIGADVNVEVTSVLMTSNGRMAFARLRSA